MNKQQLAQKLWASANDLRGKMDASEYKNYILGFLFYKFLSEHQENYFAQNNVDLSKIPANLMSVYITKCRRDLGYFIFKDDLYSTWTKKIDENKWRLADVTDAISHFNENLDPEQKEDFEGVFADVILTSEKLGKDLSDKEIAIRKLINVLDTIQITGNREYDVFGYIYEYLIAQFAMASGKKAGEFYTPHQVSRIMAKIVADELRHKDQCDVYDPTAGSGSLLLTVSDEVNHYAHKDNIRFFGQENNSTTYNIARMNLLMRGVKPANMILRNGDTLQTDWPYGEINGEDNPLFVDCVVANPPYSAKWNSERAEKDLRFKDYGIAPATKADYAFLLHSLYHLKQDGIMAIVLPHGVLFRGNEEEKIRTKLLKRRQIDTIIGLPAGIFTNTGIPTIVMILRKTAKHDNVLFIDASQGFRKEKNTNVLRERDIKKILDTYRSRQEIKGFSHLAEMSEIEDNGYNLNIPRYVTPLASNDRQNIEAHLKGGLPNEDIDYFADFWRAFPNLKAKLFTPLREGFSRLNVEEEAIFSTIEQDSDYQAFITQMHNNIKQWQTEFKTALLANETPITSSQILTIFDKLEQSLFKQFELSAFTDPYEAYQLFVDEWRNSIATDLEKLAEFGFISAQTIDEENPILPTSLIAERYFTAEQAAISALQQQIQTSEEQLKEHQTELESGLDNEDDLAVMAEIFKAAKSNAKKAQTHLTDWLAESAVEFSEEEIIQKMAICEAIYKLNKQLKTLKDELKAEQPKFEAKITAQYAKLNIEEIKSLLEQKWLIKLGRDLENIAHSYSRQVANQIKILQQRYEETLSDIQAKREQAEKDFWAMAEKLVG